jgi:hypothetical protein
MEGILLQERLCRKFCRYYKPSKDERLACMGYLVIESLAKSGREMPFPATAEKPGTSVEKMLRGHMCAGCPFYEDGCDFVRGEQDSSPCGGFIVLAHMCGTRSVSVDDIRGVIELMK